MYINAWYAEALIDAYEIIPNTIWLKKAEKILYSTTCYIDTNGQWLRYTAVDPVPKYIGMSQSILMRVMQKYLNLIEDRHLDSVLTTLAVTFVHTTEGVYNHWSNSRIGEMIRDQVLGTTLTDYVRLHNELELLYSRMTGFEGKIPYRMDSNDPLYPDFRPAYQSYDTFLLSLMSNYSESDIGFAPYFNMSFTEAVQSEYEQSIANNTGAAVYIFKQYGIRSDQFMASQQGSPFISAIPGGMRGAVSKLQTIAYLLQYDESINSLVVPETENPVQILYQNYPNPFNSQTKIEYYLPETQQVSLIIFDILGREIYHLIDERQNRGNYFYIWDAIDNGNNPVPSGIYIACLRTGKNVNVIKILVLK